MKTDLQIRTVKLAAVSAEVELFFSLSNHSKLRRFCVCFFDLFLLEWLELVASFYKIIVFLLALIGYRLSLDGWGISVDGGS